MVSKLLGQKKGMSQVWTAAGQRWPVTEISMADNVVVRVTGTAEEAEEIDKNINKDTNNNTSKNTNAQDKYQVQIAFGDKKLKNMPAPTRQQLQKAGIKNGKRIFVETTTQQDLQPGTSIRVEDVLSPGDVVNVTGQSKGRGFTGVMKRWGFAGGKRTHGQSDRERAPGSIGAGTTPGRVWKGKRMAGRSGNQQVTLLDCVVVAVDQAKQSIWVKGTVPGSYNGFIQIIKQQENVKLDLHDSTTDILHIESIKNDSDENKHSDQDKQAAEAKPTEENKQ